MMSERRIEEGDPGIALGASAVRSASERRDRAMRVCLAAMAVACSSVDTWLLMSTFQPVLQVLWEPAAFLQAISIALGYAIIAVIAAREPKALNSVVLTILSALAISVGSIAWGLGLARGSIILAVAGSSVAHLGCSWAHICVVLSLCSLGNKHDVFIAVAAGESIGAFLRCLIPASFGGAPAIAAAGLVETFMLVVGSLGARPFLRQVLHAHTEVPADLGMTNPSSFPGPSHKLMILIMFFEFIHGISLCQLTAGQSLATCILAFAVLVIAIAVVVRRGIGTSEDTLLPIAALLMLAGFILEPLTITESILSDSLSFAGAACSWLLIYGVLASVGMANPVGALVSIGTGLAMQALALEAGASLGRFTMEGPIANESIANIINTLVVIAFVRYLLVDLKGFSFSEVFKSIVPVEPIRPLEDPIALIERNCAVLAHMNGISDRELEVMCLLAQGRGGRDIQEALTISYNTTKTHVRHIYRKLGVHSQQELIDLVGSS